MNKLIKAAMLMTVMILATASKIYAQSVKELTYQAYLKNDPALWKSAVGEAEKRVLNEMGTKAKKYKLAMARYGLLGQTMSDKNEDTFDANLDVTIELLEELIDSDTKWAEPCAILSAVYGLQMGYSPWKGMFLGSKSSQLIDKAMKLDQASPTVVKLYAGSKFFTPEMFGGDLQESIENYEKSIALFEKRQTENEWLYIDAMAWLGMAYMKNEEREKAVAVFEKAIAYEPNFNWVKMALLPKAQAMTP